MLQRGRVSKANLLSFPVDVEHVRLAPPSWLTRDEKKLFVELIGACSPKHFTPSDEPLIVSYVQACLLARASIKRVGKQKGALAIWEKATRAQVAFAVRLRLAPQSRMDRKAVPRHMGPDARPWEES